jgi:hypothetical protein
MTTHRKPVKPETIVKPAPKPVEPRRSDADIQALKELRADMRDAQKGVDALRETFEILRAQHAELLLAAHALVLQAPATEARERMAALLARSDAGSTP